MTDGGAPVSHEDTDSNWFIQPHRQSGNVHYDWRRSWNRSQDWRACGKRRGSAGTPSSQNMSTLLAFTDSDLEHVVHVNAFLLHMNDFEKMNRVYAECLCSHRSARTVIGVRELPRPVVLLTMSLTAVTRE